MTVPSLLALVPEPTEGAPPGLPLRQLAEAQSEPAQAPEQQQEPEQRLRLAHHEEACRT